MKSLPWAWCMISEDVMGKKNKILVENMGIEEDYLSINEYSRPGKLLKDVKGIVVHWVQNKGTTPKQNRDFFENRKFGKTGYGSAHLFVGIEGERLICIPLEEMAYHVGAKEYKEEALKRLSSYPNNCTIGIELCHPEDDGKFTKKTIDSASYILARLCYMYGLDPLKDLWRHYDVTGKDCPKYFVDNEDEWKWFLMLVDRRMNNIVRFNGIYKDDERDEI